MYRIRANVYVKANLLHEFGGSHAVTMTDSLGNSFTADTGFKDTWFEYGVGATFTTGTNSHIYFDVERSTGSDFKKTGSGMQVHAGPFKKIRSVLAK